MDFGIKYQDSRHKHLLMNVKIRQDKYSSSTHNAYLKIVSSCLIVGLMGLLRKVNLPKQVDK